MRIEIEIGFSFKRELKGDFRHLDLPEGTDVEGALRRLAEIHPGIAGRLFDQEGRIRSYINALINGGNVVHRRGFRTVLTDGDRLTILPSVGGG